MDTTKGVCGDIGAAQGEGDKTFQLERDVKEVAERVSEKAQVSHSCLAIDYLISTLTLIH